MQPSGFGRAIAKDKSRFIDCYFKNGQCHGNVRLIDGNGYYTNVNFEDGKKEGKEICFYNNGNTEHETYFKDGKKEGKEICFHLNGNTYYETYFKNGK